MASNELLGTFELVVLLAVARLGGDGYGVTLRREIERRTGRDVAVGSVYATLARLEEKGFVTSREGEPTPVRGGRARKHFRVEPAGVEALASTRGALERLWDGLELGGADRA